MEQIQQFIRQFIQVTEEEMNDFLPQLSIRRFKKNTVITVANHVPNHVFFINKGLVRVITTDREGEEHTVYFAFENQFVADYVNFLQKTPSSSALQTLEDTEVVVMPRSALEWVYKNIREGEKIGRLIAEYHFIRQDNYIKNIYLRSPKERYDSITDTFPEIHNRVPQHMIASYLGITPVHLSRLKKSEH